MRSALLVSGLAILLPAPLRAAEPVDYVRDVQPIFAKHCTACHGAEKQKSGLRLDTATNIRKGGDRGPALEAGKGDQSRIVVAIRGGNDDLPAMPPKGPRLTTDEIAAISRWITEGAAAPANESSVAVKNGSKHWAFQPVVRPKPPNVKSARWIRNPLDQFILARLEKESISPAPEAGRPTLIRRLCLDLLGLPPTPEEVDAFTRDERPDAYERLVDRLLASPHYGERWGRFWLDAARYADSNGYSIDAARSIWPYRDWVINALNRDMPLDEFVIEQMAGDLLPNATTEQKVATGFHRNTPINEEGGIDLEQFRVDSIYDRLNTTGTVFLGLTIGCAQCHDHKFDPLTQREYYQLFAFLNNDDEPTLELGSPEQVALKKKIQTERRGLEKRFKTLDRITDKTVEGWQGKLTAEMRANLPKEIDHILTIAINGRDEHQQETVLAFVRNLDKTRHALGGIGSPIPFASLAHIHLHQTRDRIEQRLAELKAKEPNVPTTMVLKQRATPRETGIHLGGDFTRKGVKVDADTPHWISASRVSHHPGQSPSRLELAKWLVDPANPLTARVAVNRLWQGHFGQGIVETENDFGTQGTLPSHPELLDWLASEFMRQRWSLKEMHRSIVCSATYRQSSNVRAELASVDPRNKLLARMPRLRLEAEVVRDVALAASGLLSEKIGGPSAFPPQPEGVFKFTQVPRTWKADSGPNRYRRGLYTFFWRSAPHPELVAFDAPDGVNSCTRRNRSNTPLQALTLLNDEGFVEYARGLTDRILREAADDNARLQRAFRLCLGREPRSAEFERLARLRDELGNDRSAWVSVARVLMNLDEFITRE
jgi:mono/diheme cytochrome c family protein